MAAGDGNSHIRLLSYLSVIGVCAPLSGGTVTGRSSLAKLGRAGWRPLRLVAATFDVLSRPERSHHRLPAFGLLFPAQSRDRLDPYIPDIFNRRSAICLRSLAGVHLGDDELFAATPNWLAGDAHAADSAEQSA